MRAQMQSTAAMRAQIRGNSAIADSYPPSNANSRSQTPALTTVLPIRTGRPASGLQLAGNRRGSNSLSLVIGDERHSAPTSAVSFHQQSPVIGGGLRDETAFFQAESQTLVR